MRQPFLWNLGRRSLELGRRTLVMGVVNVTPDSFSDGGHFLSPECALERALQLLGEGADILDLGGESTHPGASAMGARQEQDRVLPVIEAVKREHPEAIISIDTYKAETAVAAVQAGVEIVNDVSGFRWDPRMVKTLAGLKCGAVLMHMRGRPEEWRTLPPVPDIVMLVKRELRAWADVALIGGVKRERIILDPGFGFGKSFQENYPLLKRFEELHELRYPLLAGVSRKSFIGRALARNGKDAPVGGRLYGTLAAETAVILKGAHIVRTHDVRACADAVRMVDVVVS